MRAKSRATASASGCSARSLARVHGRDLTGRTFHEALEPEPADGAVRHAMRLVDERIPLFVAGKMLYLKHKEWLNFENACCRCRTRPAR